MMIEIIDIAKKYASIENFNLTFNKGELTALVGESGCGKSTLSRLIMSLEKPDNGDIFFDGKSILKLERRNRRKFRAEIQLVLQNAPAALDPRLQVGKSIAEPLKNLLSLSRADRTKRISEVCADVSLSSELLSRLPHELSGGQLRRVCIARALATIPKFVVFDEVTSGLDPPLRKRILELILKLKKETLRSGLFITHDMDAALKVADRILVMKNGKILEDKPVQNEYADFTSDYAKLLLNPITTPANAVKINNFLEEI